MKRSWRLGFVALVVSMFIARAVLAQDRPIELKFSSWIGSGHGFHTSVLVPWARMVEERSQGKLKVTLFPGATLGKPADHWDMVKNGIADIGWGAYSYTPGRFPLTSVGDLPFLFKTGKGGSRVMWEIYQKHLQKEQEGVKILWLFVHAPGQVHTLRKPIRTLDDLGGVKLRVPGGVVANVVKQLGAIPVTIPAPDTYSALERGVVDGTIFPWETVAGFKLSELLRHHAVANLYVTPNFVAMNQRRYESLPPDLRKVIDDLSGAWAAEFTGGAWDKNDEDGIEAAKKVGAAIYTLPAEERQRWIARVKPLEDEWVSGVEAKGFPGRQVLNDLRELVRRYDP
jgi:TRAP-type C4-dicarboxylate transport system substrate-binding protein